MNRQERWRGYALASLALLLALAPLSLLLTLFAEGFSHLDWSFFSTTPEQAGRSGGIGPIILSTLWVLLICLVIVVPLGLGTALFLVEQMRPDSRANLALQWALDGLGAVPSVVFGLFGHRVFVIELGWGYSLLAGGCTLACMVLPLLFGAANKPCATVRTAIARLLPVWRFPALVTYGSSCCPLLHRVLRLLWCRARGALWRKRPCCCLPPAM